MKAETVLDETRLKRRTGSPRQRIELLRWTQSARRAQLAIADHVHEFDTAKGCRSRTGTIWIPALAAQLA